MERGVCRQYQRERMLLRRIICWNGGRPIISNRQWKIRWMSPIISIWMATAANLLPNSPLRLWSLFVGLNRERYSTSEELLITTSDVCPKHWQPPAFEAGGYSLLHRLTGYFYKYALQSFRHRFHCRYIPVLRV